MSRASRLVLLSTSLAAFVSFLDATIVNIAFPSIQADFSDASRASLSWVLNAYAIVFAALLVPAGRLADMLGRRRVFMAGLATFTVASALCAAAPSVEALVALRIVQAAGAAMVIPSSLALLLPAFAPEKRGMAVGLWGAAAAVAAATGPTLGGALIEASDWRLVFLVNIPVGAIALAVASRVLQESKDPGAGGLPDFGGSVLLMGAVGALALALVEGQDWGWTSARVLAAFAVAALLLPAFARRSARHPVPIVRPALLRVRSFAVANAASLLFAAAFYGMLLCNVLFLTGVWHYDVLKAGLAISPSPLMAAATAPFAGRLADRFGPRAVLLPGSAVFTLGVVWLATHAGLSPHYVSDWLPGAMMAGIGIGSTFPTQSTAAALELGPAEFGVGIAVNATARQLGAVFGVAAVVALLGTPAPSEVLGAFDNAWTAIAVAGGSSGLVALALTPGRVLRARRVAAVAPAA
jgi:EmrB/QacA subfamily drug resistance transporter